MSARPSMDADRIMERLRRGDRLRKDGYGWGFSVSPSDWVDGRVVRSLEQSGRVEVISSSGAYSQEAILAESPQKGREAAV